MSDKITITLAGSERDIMMSYGLLNELTTIVPSPEIAPSITLNAGLREDVLKALLAERKPTGKKIKEIEDIDDIDVSIDEIEKLLDWATEAILSFFVRSLKKVMQRVEENKSTIEGLKSSLDGLVA